MIVVKHLRRLVFFVAMFVAAQVSMALDVVYLSADFSGAGVLSDSLFSGLKYQTKKGVYLNLIVKDNAGNANRLKKHLEEAEGNPDAVLFLYAGSSAIWQQAERFIKPETLPVVPLLAYGFYMEGEYPLPKVHSSFNFSYRIKNLLESSRLNARCQHINFLLKDDPETLVALQDVLTLINKNTDKPYKIVWDTHAFSQVGILDQKDTGCFVVLSSPEYEREIVYKLLRVMDPPPLIFTLWGAEALGRTEAPGSVQFKGLPLHYLYQCETGPVSEGVRSPEVFDLGRRASVWILNQFSVVKKKYDSVFDARKALAKRLSEKVEGEPAGALCVNSYDALEWL